MEQGRLTERCSADEHLDLGLQKEFLDERPVLLTEPGVMDADAEREGVTQRIIPDAELAKRSYILFRHVQEPLRVLVAGAERDELEGREARLSPGCDEHEGGVLGGVGRDGLRPTEERGKPQCARGAAGRRVGGARGLTA